jgi:hypothetical protein
MAGMVDPSTSAKAENLPKGGNLRIGMRCMEIKDPHLADFAEKSNVVREVCEKRRKGCALTADDVVRNLKRVCDCGRFDSRLAQEIRHQQRPC